ncbi:hypothetical protein HMPREF2604_08260 [Corynebacterium sp. HMSC055A01]|nr:hypothetical protein HMPREF2604_08260 [Corynebacterium sp. HMSC055A01]
MLQSLVPRWECLIHQFNSIDKKLQQKFPISFEADSARDAFRADIKYVIVEKLRTSQTKAINTLPK